MSVDGKMCRVCLAAQRTSKFNRIFGNNGKIAKQIFELTGIKILEFKQCPALICPKCTGNLQRALELHNSILDNNRHFNEIYKICRFEEYDIEIAAEVLSDDSEEWKIEVIDEDIEIKTEPIELSDLGNRNIIKNLNELESEELIITEEIKQEPQDHTEDFTTETTIFENPAKDLIEIKTEIKEEPDVIQEFKFDDLSEEVLLALDSDDSDEEDDGQYDESTSQQVRKRRKLNDLQVKSNKEWICCYCGDNFKNKADSVKHRKTEHREEEESLNCRHCQMQFSQRHHLRIHIKFTHLEKPLICPKCNIKFSNQDTFKDHMKIENNQRNFVCKICSASCILKKGLTQHMKKHENEKHACEHCGLKFVTKEILKSHKNIVHSKLKPFRCGSCHETFATKFHLQGHLSKGSCSAK